MNELLPERFPRYRLAFLSIDNLVTDEPLELLVELNTKDDKIPHDNYVMRRDYVIKYLKKFVPELNSLGNFLNEYLYSSLDSVDLQRKLN